MADEQQIEQTQEVQSTEATRDDLIAAVREAGGTESVDVAAEEQAALERAQGGTATPAEGQTGDPDEPRIAAILRAREKAQAEREAARNHAQELIEQARQESERLLAQAREQANKDWQEELARRRAEFSQSPTAALRQLASDPQEVIDAVVREGSPEARAIAQLQKELAETRQKATVGEDVKKQLDELRAERQREAQEREVARVRSEFMGNHANAEKAPHLHARWDAEEIFARANNLAASWRQGGLQLVKVGSPKGETDFDFDDVVNYLESDSKKRLTSVLKLTPAQQSGAGAPAKEPGNAPKFVANGTRTLSAAQGSERRTSPKPLSEMSPAEQRQALIDEVAAARRANPDATS